MTQTHTLKCLAPYFDAVAVGEKNFEVQRDDRGFQKGDIIELRRWHPVDGYDTSAMELRRKVTYILTGVQFGLRSGYAVLGFDYIQEDEAQK